MSSTLDSSARPSSHLPPIGYAESRQREEAELQAAQTMVNINPHASGAPYSGGYSAYHSSTNSSAPTSASTLKTSAESHRSSQSDHDPYPNSAPSRQSLPSISEALAQRSGDEPPRDTPRAAPRSPGPSYQHSRRYSSPSPSRFSRSYGPDPKYEQKYDHYSAQRQPPQISHQAPPSPRAYGPVSTAPRPSSPREQFAVPTTRPSQQYPPPPAPSQSPRPLAAQYGPPAQSPSFAASPYIYSSRQPPASYAPQTSQEFVTSYPAVATSTYGGGREPPWSRDERPALMGSKTESREPQFATAVKRNFDYYDLDSLLNEVHECSYNLMQFSEAYRIRSHQSQRSGPIAGSSPTIVDVHQAMKFSAKITEALDFTLQKLRADEAERIEREREAAERQHRQVDRVEDVASRGRKEVTGEGGFAGPDPKKRRGRAAPPGRCHACNRAETPEWRRGPDGARTLCNACGLHYAKHTRKMGAQKAAALQGGSNLRPKSAGQN